MHYHQERAHQGLDGQLIEPRARPSPEPVGEIRRIKRLGGLLNYYTRDAA